MLEEGFNIVFLSATLDILMCDTLLKVTSRKKREKIGNYFNLPLR